MNLKPRVAIVTNIAWNIYNFRRDLARTFKEAGFQPVLIAYPDSYAGKLIEEGWEFIPFPNMDRAGVNPVKDFKLFFDFVRAYRKLKINCALHYNAKPLIYASWAASYLKIPYIPVITGLAGPFSGDRVLIKNIVIQLYKISFRKSYKVIFQNKDDIAYFLKKHIIKGNKAVLIPGSGVNMDRFRAELYGKPPADKIVFLMFARLSWAKGVGYYVEAAKQVKQKYPNVLFKLAGPFDNDKLAITKKQVEDWHNEGAVEYLGVSDFIQKEISEAHVIVYPSYYREGVPKSLIESAGMSKPIITTDNVGCRDVVDDGVNGILVPVKNAGALVNAFEKFITMGADCRKKMGDASRKIAVERFDEKKILAGYLKLVNEIV